MILYTKSTKKEKCKKQFICKIKKLIEKVIQTKTNIF